MDDAALFDRQRQLAVLQRQRSFTEQFAPPAVQGADIGLVVRRDLFEIVHRCDHLAGDGMALRRHAQQNLEQFDGR